MNLPRSKHPLCCCEQKSIPRLHKSPPDKWQHYYLENCSPSAAVSCANKISPCTAFDLTPGYEDSHLLTGLWWAVWWDLSNGGQPREREVLRPWEPGWYSLFSVYNGESLNICGISDRFKQGQSDRWPTVQGLASTAYCTRLRQSMVTCRVGEDTGSWWATENGGIWYRRKCTKRITRIRTFLGSSVSLRCHTLTPPPTRKEETE